MSFELAHEKFERNSQNLNFWFLRNMLFAMLSWNWFELVFHEIHFLKSFFWPYDILYAFKSVSAANAAYMWNCHFNDMHRHSFQF